MPWTRPWSIRFSRPVAELVDARVLRHVADRTADRVRRRGRTSWPSTEAEPSSGVRQRDEHAHRGRLARAVRAEQPEDLALGHAERDTVERLHVAVALAELVHDDRFHRRASVARRPRRVPRGDGPLRVPGQAALQPLRHPGLGGTARHDARGGARRRPRSSAAQVVVKAQVLTGGRGKAGGVKLADEPAEAEQKAQRDPRPRHSRPCRREGSGSSAPPRSRRSTTSRSRSTAARRSRSSCSRRRAASRSRRSPRTSPDALVRLHVDPLEGYQPWVSAAARLRRRRRGPGRAEADRRDRRQALPRASSSATRCSARSTR